jgi:hypothetical protein
LKNQGWQHGKDFFQKARRSRSANPFHPLDPLPGQVLQQAPSVTET